MKLLSIKPSTAKNKKYTATFLIDDKEKRVHFGSRDSSTYLDNKDDKKRDAYIARHKVRENFNNPLTAGALSSHLLWGKTTSLRENIALFKKRFNL